jgi:hypothetical protein
VRFVWNLRDRDATQPNHGDAQREIHALLPTEQGPKAVTVLVYDFQFDRIQVELGPHGNMGGLDVSDHGIAGRIPSALSQWLWASS